MILHADCLVVEGLPSLADKSVDVFIFDPPYDTHTHSAQRQGCNTNYTEPTRPGALRAQISRVRDLGFVPMTADLMEGVARECARLARRWVLTFCALEMISDWKQAFEKHGLEYVRTCIWHKRNGAPQFTGDRPAVAAEAIVCAHPPGRKRWNGRGSHGWFDLNFDPEDEDAVVLEEAIVLNRGHKRERFHTAQKPLRLMEKLVALFTDPGELVCDPFAGSGTTLLACARLGRKAIGCEIDEKYVKIAEERLVEESEVVVKEVG